ncbi:hypothetical protein [Halalkalibacter flavus]|jgi:hypothetical protein
MEVVILDDWEGNVTNSQAIQQLNFHKLYSENLKYKKSIGKERNS